jgi:hypothetical protein
LNHRKSNPKEGVYHRKNLTQTGLSDERIGGRHGVNGERKTIGYSGFLSALSVSGKKDQSKILDQLCQITSLNRKYLFHLLAN